MTVAIGPRPELLDDPRRLASRRIDQAVTNRLGPRRLLLRIARVPLLVEPRPFERLFVARGGIRQRFLRGAGVGHVQVNADALAAILHADRGSDRRTPVAALRDITCVAQAGHEGVPGATDPVDTPTRHGRFVRKSVAGQRRTDDVKRICCIATVRRGIDQRRDHLVKLHHRTRPAMGHHQRQRTLVPAAHVQEVNIQAVDVRFELGKRVQTRLGHAPVVAIGPIRAELLHVGQRHALGPV